MTIKAVARAALVLAGAAALAGCYPPREETPAAPSGETAVTRATSAQAEADASAAAAEAQADAAGESTSTTVTTVTRHEISIDEGDGEVVPPIQPIPPIPPIED